MFKTLAETRKALFSGQTTTEQLTLHYLEVIRQKASLNAFLEVFEAEALDAAKEVDKKIAQGTAGALAGMVIGIKDVLCFKGHKVSASSRILEGFESLYTATAVQRLIDADAVIIGRLNCDEFAMGSSNENSAYGNVLHPLDEKLAPGGSSGGSAVAVAAGLCLATLGTDTGGSIRQPASLCGITGMKPSYGTVSRWGCVAYASSFDQIGPMANSVEDCAAILEVIAGPDEYDSTLRQIKPDAYTEKLVHTGTAKLAYFKQYLESEGLDPEIKTAMLSLIDRLRAQGHTVDALEFPYLDYVIPVYYVLTTAEASSNLSRYDGIHYGYRNEEANNLESTYKLSRTEGFGKEVKRRIMLGTFVLSSGYYDAYYSKAQKMRRLIRDYTQDVFKNYSFLILPSTPGTAFPLGGKSNDPIQMYLEDIYTVQANICGVPAISIPGGIHSNGLPFGVQLIADTGCDAALLAFAARMQAELQA
jgi:aspartyl-tRNA(Asn)/glutamyl-tRNA(Gln) amidotransferase subunit A